MRPSPKFTISVPLRRERYQAIPFFWTQQYDVSIKYVGYAEKWDAADIDGSFEDKDCVISYGRDGHTLAVATIGRDLMSLKVEAKMEASLLQSSERGKKVASAGVSLRSFK